MPISYKVQESLHAIDLIYKQALTEKNSYFSTVISYISTVIQLNSYTL